MVIKIRVQEVINTSFDNICQIKCNSGHLDLRMVTLNPKPETRNLKLVFLLLLLYPLRLTPHALPIALRLKNLLEIFLKI